MTKVSFKNNTARTLNISVDKSMYFGVVIDGTKSFITREKFDSGYYILRVPQCITNGNGYSELRYRNLSGLIRKILMMNKRYNFTTDVYIFDLSDQLFRWLSEL